LLPNGKVLVAGGFTDVPWSSSAELNDPATGSWTATASLSIGRQFPTATLLPNGKVLVAGGFNNFSGVAIAELYDPANGSWTATGSLNTGRWFHSAALLLNGKVLVASGYASTSGETASAELYDPANGSWTFTGSLNTARNNFTAMLLPDGKVLVAAGRLSTEGLLASAELYTPEGITLRAAKRRVNGINTVKLTWSGATSANIDVYRNGPPPIATVSNTGTYIDSTGDTGQARYTYRVCEAGTATCSNIVRVTFPQ
jgi:hypothetical protein